MRQLAHLNTSGSFDFRALDSCPSPLARQLCQGASFSSHAVYEWPEQTASALQQEPGSRLWRSVRDTGLRLRTMLGKTKQIVQTSPVRTLLVPLLVLVVCVVAGIAGVAFAAQRYSADRVQVGSQGSRAPRGLHAAAN